ncbi:efflux RND transporter periplasmic adaptor subunit [Oleiagrimonas soli]|uniref:Multidrug efflux pump subunit AcrA (Membrane-fusion protein) n=1 Tax=Oleiagrimonas soli TaxID=1543381 RepID=A0A099CU26_9GAMM|nr:HlyD family efflux transporter periplasmic adaptor subunit [Oleiagrimonas soli]KGI77107.1 RND transporter [Oleiagrimonas soli]MBB6185356.1 multidrug efflux pump subunit AcrA (membrane-fusion protein) [Oleiagrimonas soli]
MDIANPKLKQRKKRKRLLLIGGGVAALLLVVATAAWMGPALPSADRSSLWIGTVKRGDMLREVRATGTLVPRHKRWISAATAAQVDTILVWPGATVKPDTVLMKLSNPEVADALRNAQAQVAAAEADVASKRAQLQSQLLDERSALAQAQSDYASAKVKADADEKAEKLNLIPRVEFQQGQIALKQLKARMEIEQQRVASFAASLHAQMDAVEAHLAQQRSNLQLRQRQADALDVKAGIAGVLQQVPVQEGAQVAAGVNLAQVARPDVLIARLKVPEVQAKDVVVGMPVSVDTHNGLIAGQVERIDPAVTDGSVQVDVRLTGKLPPGARPDLSVDGRIRIALLKNVLSVGRPALAKADSDISLFRIDSDDATATRVPVRVGATSVDRVQVLRGLKAGDQVILSDASQWDGYDRIRVR